MAKHGINKIKTSRAKVTKTKSEHEKQKQELEQAAVDLANQLDYIKIPTAEVVASTPESEQAMSDILTGKPISEYNLSPSETECLLNKVQIAKLMARGWTPSGIAEKLKLPRHVIVKQWSIIISEASQKQTDEAKIYIAIKLQEYGEIKREAWEAWERSKAHLTETIVEEVSSVRFSTHRNRRTRKGRNPSSDYLSIVLRALDAERELLGLNPAKSIQVSGQSVSWQELADGVPNIVPDDVEQLIMRELAGPTAQDSTAHSRGDTIVIPQSDK